MSTTTIGVVGPCASGKSTLITALKERGYQAKHIAQEHSYVQAMWKLVSNPDILIFLDVSYELSIRRRNLNWTILEYQEQQNRLRHARRHADLILDTDPLTPQEVFDRVLDFINDNPE